MTTFPAPLTAPYVAAGGIEDPKAPLFQSVDRTDRLSGRPLARRAVLAMIKRRAAGAGLPASTCCHTFRATGITAYLSNGGTLEHAQRIGVLAGAAVYAVGARPPEKRYNSPACGDDARALNVMMLRTHLVAAAIGVSLTAFVTLTHAQDIGPKRVQEIRAQAEAGDASAQVGLAAMYVLGQGVPQDYAEAARWLRRAAVQGDADAQASLANLYDGGHGVLEDDAEALRWYCRAAEQGNTAAQTRLGAMYAGGVGVPQDYAEALRWSRRAAEHGSTDAQLLLGMMYEAGQGVPQDYAEAARWYRLAAEQGDAGAQTILGLTYVVGKGVPQDNVLAHMWLNLAASRSTGENRERAVEARDKLAAWMTREQIAKAQRRAREWRSHSGR